VQAQRWTVRLVIHTGESYSGPRDENRRCLRAENEHFTLLPPEILTGLGSASVLVRARR
jgi:hypothetical protein